jgi:hypothetical protein
MRMRLGRRMQSDLPRRANTLSSWLRVWVAGAAGAGLTFLGLCLAEVAHAWRGVAWRGVAWRGVAWRGVAWQGISGLGIGQLAHCGCPDCAVRTLQVRRGQRRGAWLDLPRCVRPCHRPAREQG